MNEDPKAPKEERSCALSGLQGWTGANPSLLGSRIAPTPVFMVANGNCATSLFKLSSCVCTQDTTT